MPVLAPVPPLTPVPMLTALVAVVWAVAVTETVPLPEAVGVEPVPVPGMMMRELEFDELAELEAAEVAEDDDPPVREKRPV